MNKQLIIILISVLLIVVGLSGCFEKQEKSSPSGCKKLAIDCDER